MDLNPVLVTGGCGCIGFHIIQKLLEADAGSSDIHVLDINTTRNRLPGVTYHTGDMASAADVSAAVQACRPRTIFHIASPDSMVIEPQLFQDAIVGGARHLLAAAAALGSVQALVYCSTSSVVHDNVTDLIDADETLPILRPPVQKRVYTLTKATAEEEILAANRRGGVDGPPSMLTVSMRPCTAFGERDTTYLTKIIAVAQRGANKYQMGKGKNIYDFVYVGNLADAHILAARALVAAYGKPPIEPADMRVEGENFNVTNDEHVDFWAFTRQIGARAGYPVKEKDVVVLPLMLALLIGWVSEWVVWAVSRGRRQPQISVEAIRLSSINRTMSVEKAKRVLGYRPKVSIEDGIRKGLEWWFETQGKEKAEGEGGK